MTIGPLFFIAPWALAGLLALPVIWWLLRILPPAPMRVRFPAIGLLLGLTQKEETPAHTPWWLLALRLAVCALVIAALSDPLWPRAAQVAGSGRLLIVVDDGWTAASGWGERTSAARGLIDQAEREDRPVILTGTAPRAQPLPLEAGSAGDALSLLESLTPLPWMSDRAGLAARLEAMAGEAMEPIWISSGLSDGGEAALVSALEAVAGGNRIRVLRPTPESLAWGLTSPVGEAGVGELRVLRPGGGAAAVAAIEAHDRSGRLVATSEAVFSADATESLVSPDIPPGLRNRIAMFSLADHASAGSVHLLDERDRRRPVALVSGDSLEATQPLLSGLYYLERALESHAEIHYAPEGGDTAGVITDLIGEGVSVLIAADVGRFTPTDQAALESWIDSGGILVRFAGPRLAAQGNDPGDNSGDALVPVPLRRGDRTLGGALSWSAPQGLGAFDPGSPFYGLEVPADVLVKRQVLAEPVPELPLQTWARLSDGTPLVTARSLGEGRLILFHVSANTDWSTLPISGLYVEMLRRIVALSAGVNASAAEDGGGYLPPTASLDSRGVLGPPPATALPLRLLPEGEPTVDPHHPPGFYGRGGAERALNVLPGGPGNVLSILPALGGGIIEETLDGARDLPLKRWLMGLALALLLADGVMTLWLSGLLSGFSGGALRRGVAATALVLIMSAPAYGQVPGAALETRLGYVLTGEAAVDEMSRAGLLGLSTVLRARTSMEPGAPDGVNIERDELAFYPLLYWPLVASQPAPPDRVLLRIGAYMRQGGMIVFDTRGQGRNFGALTGGTDPGTAALRRVLSRLDIPPLTPIPSDHVLTKSFYLLREFPGRWQGGTVWVEASGGEGAIGTARRNDGVSAVVVGGNDWAAAWARDSFGRPLVPILPGGERQRELAARVGVNLVMYALTGNYKADQVHVPALLERLGQ